MNKKKSQMLEEDILFEFSQEAVKDAGLLERYINLYPEYRDALVALSVDLLISQIDSFALDMETEPSGSVEKAWSQFQALLSPSDPAFIKSSNEENPLIVLDQKGFIAIAKSLDVSRTFLSRFRDNSVLVTTIPNAFLQKLAEALGVEFDRLRSLLNSSPRISAGVSFKSEGQPIASKKITFDEAVENSGLSDAQKAKLRTIKE
jgi:transcriptional regulator with XRE-family HTH domain